LIYVRRAGTEARKDERKRWLKTAIIRRIQKTRRIYRAVKEFKPDSAIATALKIIVSRYYQLKIGYAAIGVYF
jgi:hypothetical protein